MNFIVVYYVLTYLKKNGTLLCKIILISIIHQKYCIHEYEIQV